MKPLAQTPFKHPCTTPSSTSTGFVVATVGLKQGLTAKPVTLTPVFTVTPTTSMYSALPYQGIKIFSVGQRKIWKDAYGKEIFARSPSCSIP